MIKFLIIGLVILLCCFIVLSYIYIYILERETKGSNEAYSEYMNQKKYTDFPFVCDQLKEYIVFSKNILLMENNGPDICNIDDSEEIIFDDYFSE